MDIYYSLEHNPDAIPPNVTIHCLTFGCIMQVASFNDYIPMIAVTQPSEYITKGRFCMRLDKLSFSNCVPMILSIQEQNFWANEENADQDADTSDGDGDSNDPDLGANDQNDEQDLGANEQKVDQDGDY
ncbi:hypothetical protein RDI58_016639 [Solanum bulbocastanum]|uniref:Uncharacterized protein n=1 Tax=Solanum bulbocastanum TaxID=147425 RepID=A0AAN8THU8_SOLBU